MTTDEAREALLMMIGDAGGPEDVEQFEAAIRAEYNGAFVDNLRGEAYDEGWEAGRAESEAKLRALREAAVALCQLWFTDNAPDGSQHIRKAMLALRAALAATPAEKCTCGGRRWVEDENWTPDNPRTWRGERSKGDGLIPCGFCNEGGWDTPEYAATPAEEEQT